MKLLPPLLLLDRDPHSVAVFRSVIESERGLRLLVASGSVEAGEIAAREHPGLVAVAFEPYGVQAFDLGRRLRSEPWGAGVRFLLIVESDAHEMRASALDAGVDDVLVRPLDPVALQARVKEMLRVHELLEGWQGDRRELERMRVTLDRGGDQAVALLSSLLDMLLPGGAARGAKAAALSGRIADRFGVPEPLRSQLVAAARLHELGRITAPQHLRDSRAPGDAWQIALTTKAMLLQFDPLHGAADVVGTLYENWDGSGHPDHLRQGQIPLRSRILRAVADFQAAHEETDAARRDWAVESFFGHTGALYDPVVIVHLRAILGGTVREEASPQFRRVTVNDLEAGMVLAEDLSTESGTMLLARDTRLTPAALETILRRHQVDPIVRAISVRRVAA